MKLGDKGEAVRNLQLALKEIGYAVIVDGIYGPQTEQFVKVFQKSKGLVVDGIAGPKTLAVLKARRPLSPEEHKLPVVKPVAYPTPRPLADILARAWYWTTQKAKYVLGAGGRDPNASSPFTTKDGVVGSDCVGWVLWACGIDRYQPKLFTYYDGWMNTDSIIEDAKRGVGGKLWKLLAKPEVGCLVIFPSIHKNGKMTRMGHVGLVVEVPAEWPDDFASWPDKERKELLKLVKVIDCNASWGRKLKGKAIGQITAADLWNKPDAVFVAWVR